MLYFLTKSEREILIPTLFAVSSLPHFSAVPGGFRFELIIEKQIKSLRII